MQHVLVISYIFLLSFVLQITRVGISIEIHENEEGGAVKDD